MKKNFGYTHAYNAKKKELNTNINEAQSSNSNENEDDDLPCAICLVDFADLESQDEQVIVLPCKAHYFHVECIETWLQKNSVCPICRQEVTKDNLKE